MSNPLGRSFGDQILGTVFEVAYKLTRHYTGKLVILFVSLGRCECGTLETKLLEKGFSQVRGGKVYVTTAGVNLVGSLTLVLLGSVGFLIWYLREADRSSAYFFAWVVAGVVLGFALLRIWWNFIKLRKEDAQGPADAFSCTLVINNGQSSVPHPTESDLRKTLALLQEDEELDNLVLCKGSSRIQVTCVAKDSFVIQTQESEEQHLYQSTNNLSTEASMKLLRAFRSGDPNWKKLADWK
jgi:hypothetical protein